MQQQQPIKVILRALVSVLLLLVIYWACVADESDFLRINSFLMEIGTVVALLETLLTVATVLFLVWGIRHQKSKKVWFAGVVFAMVALAANMADYFGTLQMSPDLALELNPAANGLLKILGFEFVKDLGLFSKPLASVMAGASFMFYLGNVERLMPRKPLTINSIFFRLGEQCTAPGEKWIPFVTVLAFYFAAVNLFCFYIAYVNSLVNDLPTLRNLPTLPAAVCIALALITLAFVVTTYCILRSLSKRCDCG